MKSKASIIIGIVLICLAVLLGIMYLKRQDGFTGSISRYFDEPSTGVAEFDFVATDNDDILYSYTSNVKSDNIEVILVDSEGNTVITFDNAKKLQEHITIEKAGTYTLRATYTDFKGKFNIFVKN